jgi:hypothetical protein
VRRPLAATWQFCASAELQGCGGVQKTVDTSRRDVSTRLQGALRRPGRLAQSRGSAFRWAGRGAYTTFALRLGGLQGQEPDEIGAVVAPGPAVTALFQLETDVVDAVEGGQ